MENKDFIMARTIAEAVGRLGGRTFFVGGYVRDRIMDEQRSEDCLLYTSPSPRD